jgi:hypothetical protein
MATRFKRINRQRRKKGTVDDPSPLLFSKSREWPAWEAYEDGLDCVI